MDAAKCIAIWGMVTTRHKDKLFDLVRCALLCIVDDYTRATCVDFWDYLADKDKEMRCLAVMSGDMVRRNASF